MCQILTVVLFTLTLIFSGVLIINWQIWYSTQTTTIKIAHLLVHRIENVLDEAQLTTEAVKKFSQGSCSPEVKYGLNQETVLRPHIRAVALLKESTIWCSSLIGHSQLALHHNTISGVRLTLYSGVLVTPEPSFLVWFTSIPNGYIAVIISSIHISDILALPYNEPPLLLIIGNNSLNYQGVVSHLQTSVPRMLQIHSSHYPFSIRYTLPSYFSFSRLIQQGGVLLVMIFILSLTGGVLLCRYLTKYTTPIENLKRAIDREEIIPYYQPIVNVVSGAIEGIEVLARWKHPKVGFIPPDIFIPMAEKSGIIIILTQYLLKKIQNDITSLISMLPDRLHVGINISATHIKSDQLVSDCMDFLNAFNVNSIKLTLELTEREPIEMSKEVKGRLALLRSKGVVLALDDFGTGYSGLSYLNEPIFDVIKIDRSFVSRITDEPESTLLVDCVIEMARKMSLSVIAEGVETQIQANYLNQHGISLQQGYYFFHPMPFLELLAILTPEGTVTD